MCTDELVLYKMHLLVNSERQSGCGCVWNVVCLLLIKDIIKWPHWLLQTHCFSLFKNKL